jgi:hypothetical protein
MLQGAIGASLSVVVLVYYIDLGVLCVPNSLYMYGFHWRELLALGYEP